MTHPLLTVEVAVAIVAHLNEQAARTGLKGADGETLKYKAVRVTEDRRVKAAFEVRAIEMKQSINLMSKLPFWHDVDDPYYLLPSSETYWSR